MNSTDNIKTSNQVSTFPQPKNNQRSAKNLAEPEPRATYCTSGAVDETFSFNRATKTLTRNGCPVQTDQTRSSSYKDTV